MDFDINKLIGSKLPNAAMSKEDTDYLTAAQISKWRHECKSRSTYLMHGNLVTCMVASVLGEPNMFFVPEKEDIVVVIANSPMVALQPEFLRSVNYAFYVMWPELRPFNYGIAMRCVKECATQLEWSPHNAFAVVMDQREQSTDGGPPGMRLYRGVLVVSCEEHAEMNAKLAATMVRAWNTLNKPIED